MEEYDYNTIKEVGKVSYDALQYSKTVVKEGKRLLDIAEEIEKFIKGKGFEMAFPVNLSIDENAAHYTPGASDPYVLKGTEVIKVDVGARKGEYLGDCATTIDMSQKHQKMVDAVNEALDSAISLVRAGREVREIGREIEKIAISKGFTPIRNLGGHGISKVDLHADIFIPNFDNGDTTTLEEGQVIAIEPFITDGIGMVGDGQVLEIFQKTGDAAIRARESRDVVDFIDKNYSTYPFALRWLQKEFSKLDEFKIRRALNELAGHDALESFPVLIERKAGIVAQAEKEMIVEKSGCKVITE